MRRSYLCTDCQKTFFTSQQRGVLPDRCPDCREAHLPRTMLQRGERRRRRLGIPALIHRPNARPWRNRANERRCKLIRIYDKYGLTWKGRDDE